jgi:Ca2+-binding RTX toxin-like protein
MFETLEARRFLTVTASFNAGVLAVTSDGTGDHVLIGRDNHHRIFVHADHHVVLDVPENHVTRITVDLGGGNDALATQHIHAPMTIHGGPGNDVLVGGTGHDMIFGDDGDDQITSNDGVVDTVDGGAGHDTALVDHVDHLTNVEHVHFGHHHHHHHFAIADTKNEDIRSLLA